MFVIMFIGMVVHVVMIHMGVMPIAPLHHSLFLLFGFHIAQIGFHLGKIGFHIAEIGFHIAQIGFHIAKIGFHIAKTVALYAPLVCQPLGLFQISTSLLVITPVLH